MLYYCLLFIILIIILMFVYIRLKFKFWAIQPVFHIYDIKHWLLTDRVINLELPKANKYVKLLDICTNETNMLSQSEKNEISTFICDNFIYSSIANYYPKEDDIFLYFNTIIGKSYISIFLDNMTYAKKNIIGIIMSRPLFITFSGKSSMIVNYIDNLNVRIDRRKEGIASKLIQTHEYQIRHLNPNVNVCIFKREGDMTAIVPLTIYKTKDYNIVDICRKKIKIIEKVIKIDKNNFIYFKSIIKTSIHKFKCTLNMELTTLYQLVIKSKIIIYIILSGNVPICCYVLRTTPYIAEGSLACIELIATINCSPFIDIFLAGFQTLCRREARKQKIQRIIIEETGDTCKLICQLERNNIKCKTECIAAFFLYNYAHYTVSPDQCFFIY